MNSRIKCTCGWSWNKSDSSKKDMYICHECGRDNSNNMKNGGWLDNYGEEANANEGHSSAPENWRGEGYSNVGRDYSPAWGGQFQMGGSVYPVNYVPQAQMGASMPGAVGFTYARTQGSAPSNGKYAKKTKASAQDGEKLDVYDNPLLARRVDNNNIDRSYYDPRFNTMNIGTDYNTWKDEGTGEQLTGEDLKYHQDKLLAHENYHALQHLEGRDNYDIAHDTKNRQWAEMQKRPEMMSTDSVWNNFYNRSALENRQDYTDKINDIPEARLINQNLLFDKVLDRERYSNPGNLEGEAKFYEDTGVGFKNGGKMQYYQNGLDWKPKSISKDGGWLDEAQYGAKKFKLKDEREDAYKPSESTSIKKPNFELYKSKLNKTYVNQAKEQKIENTRRKKLTPVQREREDEQRDREEYNARNEETGSIQDYVPESTWDRTKAIVSNPLTAFGYVARNESLPARFQYGPRNDLDTPIDFINPLQGIAAASEIPGELSRGEFLNAGLSALDAVDLGVYAKGAMKASKPILKKVGKQLAKDALPIFEKAKKLETLGRETVRGINDNVIYPIKYRKEIANVKNLHSGISSELGSDEAIKRLSGVLGIDPTKLDYPSLTTTPGIGSHYDSSINNINMDFRQLNDLNDSQFMLPANTVHGHELGHWMQREANRFSPEYKIRLDNYEKQLAAYTSSNNKNLLNKNLTGATEKEIQDWIKSTVMRPIKPILIPEPTRIDNFAKKLYGYDRGAGMIDISGVSNQVDIDKLNNTAKYFTNRGVEPLAHLREMRQNMLNKGYIKNIYDPISEKTINQFISKNPFDRVSSFTTPDSKQSKGLETIFRNLPSVVGAGAVGTGAAYQMQNEEEEVPGMREGGIIKDDRGQWDHPGEITEIGSNQITMEGVPYDVLGVSDTGDVKMMKPGQNYKFKGKKVTEYPIAEDGIETTTEETTIPPHSDFINSLIKDKKQINIRETPNTVVNDNIPNASKMAIKGDKAIVKDVKYSRKVAAEKAKLQKAAQKEFNALPKKEQERILYDLNNQENGTISEYTPDSNLSKLSQSAVAPFTALTDLYQNGEVRNNLLRSIVNNPKSANAYDLAYLGTLGYAAAPYVGAGASAVGSAVAPYITMIGNALATDAVIGGNTIAGLNLGNALTAGFGVHGAMNIAPDVSELVYSPSFENAEKVGMDALELAPLIGPTGKFVGEGLGYLGNKGRQALAKANEVITPTLNKTKTLFNDMSAVMTREIKTIDPKLNALNNAESAVYQTPEYSQFGNDNLKLNQKKWAIEGKINQLKNKGQTAELNALNDKINKLDKRIDVAGQFRLNNEGLVQSGKDTSLGLRTGSTDIIDLSTGEKFSISTSVPSQNIIHKLEGNQVVKNIDNSPLPQASPEYNTTVKKNIDFIETQIPGAKVFGSAKNVAETEIPHIVGDYDVLMSQTQYDKFAKANPSVGNNGFAELHNIPGAAKGIDPIDINIIQEKAGKATGTRAEELFKQVAPDEYYTAAKQAIKNKSEIKIPYSSQELVDMTNPTTKSVVDAYESTKDKHINKIDALINYGKPSVVSQGQEQFVKSLVGNKGSIGHQFPLEQLSNAETNAEILDKIGFIGNKQLVAADAERMQLAINDYYMNNSILSRQVDNGKINKIEAAIKEYYPDAGGGAVNGIGQNHVMLGHPFHGDGNIISMKQLGMNLDTKDPMSYINSIEHQVSGEKLFSEEERAILSDIVKNMKLDDYSKNLISQGTENTSQLIENLPYSEEGKKALYEFGKRTNRTIVKKSSQYGNSTYASTLRDFDDAIDAMQYQITNSKNAIKSFRQRSDAAQYASNNSRTLNPDLELLPKQFKAIKGYLEGGIDKANERLNALSTERRKIGDDVTALADKVHSKKYKDEIERLNSYKAKIDKEVSDIHQMRRDLYDRKVHLRNLEEKMKTVGILGGGVTTLVALGVGHHKLNKRQEKEWKEYEKEYKAKMTKGERKEYERQADSIQKREDRPFLDKSYDWLMGKKENGGTITKAKDGNQLVKLDQLTNFTNYNKPQPGGWLNKYN